ncbi:MAG: hypothetical protein AAGI13_04805 [Pseudomonadota bacterium]
MRSVLLLAGLVAVSAFGPASAHDSATEAEQVEIVKSLADAGCTAKPEDMVEHDGGFEVLEAACTDGIYFLVLDGSFAITKKIKL